VPLTPEQLTAMYGSPEAGEARMAEEQAWICPRPDRLQTHSTHAGGFLAPERTVVIGTNGAYCFAMQCTSDDSRHDLKLNIISNESAEQDVGNYYTEYERHNAAVAYKLRLLALERSSFVRSQRFHLRSATAASGASSGKELLKNMQKYAIMDVMLRDPLRKLAARYKLYTKNPLETRFEPRPPGATAVKREPDMPFKEAPVTTNDTSEGDMWRLLVFNVSSMKQWKDVNIVMRTEPGSAPAAAFNDMELALLWVPPNRSDLCLQMFAITTTTRPQHTSTRWFDMPESMRATPGLMTMHLNTTTGHITVAKGNTAIILPPAIRDKLPIRVYTLNERTITAAHTYGVNMLALCTNEGECVLVDTVDAAVPGFTLELPCAEPVFGMRWMPNGMMLFHTVMGIVSVENDGRGAMTLVPMIRPTCMDACGAMFFVGNKSGIIVARRPNLADERPRYFDPPQKAPVSPILQQHAFDGLRVLPTRVVHVNQAGVVQQLVLK
jgi:hypothetical protein